MARVVIEQLTKVFPGPKGGRIPAVEQLSLTVADGEFLALVGPSGCGKTTTLRLIAGLERPDGGSISINGNRVEAVAPKDRDVAMVFQNHALYPHMTAYENMAFGLRLRKVPRDEMERRVRDTAGLLGLDDCLQRLPGELSGGQRQRVALGRAIVRKPGLFLFDEPLSNLDAPLRAQLRHEILSLHRQLGSTSLCVTHDQAEAMAMGDRIAVLKAGVLQQVDKPLDIYHRPANWFVAGFFGSPPMNFFNGLIVRRDGGMFFQEQTATGEAAIGSFTVRLEEATADKLAGWQDRKIVLGLRPEAIAEPAGPHEQTVNAMTQFVEALGAETHLHLRSGAHAFVARLPTGFQRGIQQKIALTFDLRHAHFFDPDTGRSLG